MIDKLHDPNFESLEHEHLGLDQRNKDADSDADSSCNQARPQRESSRSRTACDDKEAQRQLPGWSDEDLKQIPLLPTGIPLEQGPTYVDLRDPARREFTATGEMRVPDNGLYVPRSEVPDQLWNRLLGVRTLERMG